MTRARVLCLLSLIVLVASGFYGKAVYTAGPDDVRGQRPKVRFPDPEEMRRRAQQQNDQSSPQQVSKPAVQEDEYEKMRREVASRGLQVGKEVWAKFGATIQEVHPGGIVRILQNGQLIVSGAGLKPHTIPDLLLLVTTVDRKIPDERSLSKVERSLGKLIDKKDATVGAQVQVWEVKTLPQSEQVTIGGTGGLGASSGSRVIQPRILDAKLLIRLHTRPDIRLTLSNGMYVEAMCLTEEEEAFIRADRAGAVRPLTAEQYALAITSVRGQKGGAADLQQMAKSLRSEIPPTARLELDLWIVEVSSSKIVCTASGRTTGRELRYCLEDCAKDLLRKAHLPAGSPVAVLGIEHKDKSGTDYGERASQMLTSSVVDCARDFGNLTILTRADMKSVLEEKNLSATDLVRDPGKAAGLTVAKFLLLGSVAELM